MNSLSTKNSMQRFFMMVLLFTVLFFKIDITLYAVLGDCNGDGATNVSDVVFLENYFFANGMDIINYSDCDCDGMPGINMGDVFQIFTYVWNWPVQLYPGSTADYPVGSDVSIIYDKYPRQVYNSLIMRIYIDVPDSINLLYYGVPFSYTAETDQMSLRCDSIVHKFNFPHKSLFSPEIEIMQDEELILIENGFIGYTIVKGGTSGLLCTVYFTELSEGTPNDIKVTSTDRGLYPLLMTDLYRGVNGVSKLLPMISSTIPGDANCDGKINITDAIWLITYLYAGGPAPGDCVH